MDFLVMLFNDIQFHFSLTDFILIFNGRNNNGGQNIEQIYFSAKYLVVVSKWTIA